MVDGNDTAAQIVEHARDVIVERGLAGFSLREVSRRVGISAPAVYRHFESKEDLVFAVTLRGFELFTSYLWRALEAPDSRSRLTETGEQYLRFGLEQSHYYRIIFMTGFEEFGFEKMPDHTRERASGSFQFLVDRVRACMDDGSLRCGDEQSVAATVWAHTHGLVSLHLVGQLEPGCKSVDEFVDFYRQSMARLFEGLQ